ncbi:hypothetical protein BDV96DRAFT_587448 [Lophiotrema nucula]|uniref:Uncharacterized protein n=1 Tax=Lophiotrema nucula TaxID=690887 RepID=A0A6A5YND6_9PLEO|nr:hypothetical protein BDV96DRAFT_587448 [Lophiotrema nucula]
MASIQLPHTLQTCVGMVLDNGLPRQRYHNASVAQLRDDDALVLAQLLPGSQSYTNTSSYQAPDIVTAVASEYLRDSDSRIVAGDGYARDVQRYAANLSALRAGTTIDDIKQYIRTRTRFDLEQAAAVVVSAFVNHDRVEDAVRLVGELGTLLATSCMWVEPGVVHPMSKGPATAIEKIGLRLQQSAAKQRRDIPLATTLQDLVPLLLRVRRRKPTDRCLHIPQWMFDAAGIEPPTHFKTFFEQVQEQGGMATHLKGSINPTAPAPSDVIVLSRKHFIHIQRRIYRLFQFWKLDIALRRKIKDLEDKVLYAGNWIEAQVFQTEDVALLCHYLFYFQRCLQRKVVSDMGWSSFLAKGEGAKLYQNNLRLKSTFEDALLAIAESNEEGIIVAMGGDDTLGLIDECCLLMKEYVDIYGAGRTENLTFKPGEHSGSGRGPVDEYNLLCDILAQLRQQAKDEGITDVPGLVYKFLAKDIMRWNNAWGDDAFANGRKAGWEDWVIKRGLAKDEDGDWGIVDEMELVLR